jgi:hypothetical protein
MAIGSLGMAIMFIALILLFFNFLIGLKGNGPDVYVDPIEVVIQLMSVAGVFSLILSCTVFRLTKSYDTINAAIILRIREIILLVCMVIAAWILIPKIKEQLIAGGIDIICYISIVTGVATAILGSYLLRKLKNYQDLEVEIH